jgi:trigger factor
MSSTKAILDSKTVLQGVVDLVISVPAEALPPYLERGALDLQKTKPVAGFRPGKAPFAEVSKARGEMVVLEAGAKYAVAETFKEIVEQEKLDTVGEPELQILKMSPGQPLQYSAKLALKPEVTVGDYSKIKVKTKEINIPTEEIDRVVEELRDMRSTQVKVDRPATKDDRVIIDLNMMADNVPLEGGQAKDHTIDLFRPYFIEGLADQLIGLAAGEDKSFPLTFPTEHYDKKLAGRKIDFAVKLKEVQAYTKPELDETFLKSLGNFKDLAELRSQLADNLKGVQQGREDQRVEREIIDGLIKQSKFSDIPEVLIDAELQKIFWRLKSRVESEGGSWNDYLESLKKNPEELIAEWRPEAETRVKANLLVLQIAEEEGIKASDEEISQERATILAHYNKAEDEDIRREIQEPDYNKHIRHIIITRKVMDKLKQVALN